MSPRQHNLRPAAVRRLPQRYQYQDQDQISTGSSSRNSRETSTTSARSDTPESARRHSFSSRPVDLTDHGPSDLVEAMRVCTTNDETRQAQTNSVVIDWTRDQGKQRLQPRGIKRVRECSFGTDIDGRGRHSIFNNKTTEGSHCKTSVTTRV